MKRYVVFLFAGLMAAIMIGACQTEADQKIETRWAGETLEEIIGSIESQIGGFSATMVEVNYRYNELYWAGKDENWGYADYQLDKLLSSMENGFIRRPDREASASQFMNQVSPALQETIENTDKDAFVEQFNRFASSCNTCHDMEAVNFIQVIIPEVRTTLTQL